MRVGVRVECRELRRLVIVVLLTLLCGCQDAVRPSILLVTVDTLRADHVGAYGFEANTTPNLDALAGEGVVFERALAASSRTAPSHATMMTSRWVRNHSIGPINGGTRLAHDEPTLASRLHDAGWNTAAFVSNFMLGRRVGLDTGFGIYDDELRSAELNRPRVKERSAEDTTELALRWLGPGERDQPFFLWVHYNDPHGPYVPPPPHDAISLPTSPDAPAETTLPVLDQQLGLRGIPAYQKLGELSDPSEYHRRYAGEIQYFDASFGRLLAAAESAAAPRPLIVLLTSDHGESLGEQEIYFSHGHGTTPELAHVPFVLRAPGLAPERRRGLVHHVDILPTLLDLAGLPVPDEASGLPLGSLLAGEAELPTRTVFVDVGTQVSAYRGDRLLRAHVGKRMGNVETGSWDSFRWLAGDDTHLQPEPPAPELRAEIMRYLQDRAPMLSAGGLSPEKKAMLRALGYLPPAPN